MAKSFFDVMKEVPVDFSKGEKFPWPNRFSIETSSYCNRRCSFCPISGFGGPIPRPRQQLMSGELYVKIVSELAKQDFDGCVQLFLLNEPTLDKRAFEEYGLAWTLRQACPGCTIYVSTNGDTICGGTEDPIDMCDRLTGIFDSGVNVVNLNVYDSGEKGQQRLEHYQKMREIALKYRLWRITNHKYRWHNTRQRHVAISDMRIDRPDGAPSFDMFHSKGKATRKDAYCSRPHRHMVIQWDGRVPLCCAINQESPDAVFVGDVNIQSITDVWNSEALFKYRHHLQHKLRDLPNCDTCDHKMSYSHVIRKVTADPEVLQSW